MFITMSISLIDVFNESDMRRSRQNSIKHLAYQLNTLLLPIIFTLYFILKIVENAHYPNYVFATFHIQQDTLVYGMFLGGWLILINSLKKVKTFFAKVFADLEKYWEFVLVIILLACLLMLNITKTFSDITSNNVYILGHLTAKYEDKMYAHWGIFYKYMTFVKNNTPVDTTIVIPPQESPWLSSGNIWLVRAFLYPRNLVQGSRNSLPDIKFGYILIDKGEWPSADNDYGWPKVEIFAKRVIYFSDNPNTTYNITYFPEDNKESWGLIEVEVNDKK